MKKYAFLILAAAFLLLLAACGNESGKTEENGSGKTEVPEDFVFSLTWGCCGDSTYNSETGELVKQKIATDVSAYTTTFFPTDEQKAEIYALIAEMQPEEYPDEFDPIKGKSSPSRNIILTVTMNGKTKTITCLDVSFDNTPDGAKGKKFMAVHDAIVSMLTNSEEWLALPDYEFYYD